MSRLRVQSSDGVRAARALPPIGPAFTGDSFLSDEEESLRWLEARGVPGVDRRSVDTLEEAVAAADRLGYPVVLKGRGRGIAHKTELGWVCTDVRSPDELRRLVHEMRSGSAGAHLEGFLVARRMTSGIELLVGLSHDPVLGPVITLGAGGVEAEIKRDTALSVLPLLPDRAEAMVNRLRISPLFDGWRGNPAIDRQPLVEVLLAMASLAVGGEAEEIDINPLLATPDRVVALDALVRIRR